MGCTKVDCNFVATMDLPRFKQLLQFIAFDNKETRDERYKSDKRACGTWWWWWWNKSDKMAACREVFEVFNDNCGEPLMPSP